MRILHVVNLVDDQASYGGPLTVAVNQCRELRARGHDAQILAGWRGRGRPPTEVEGVPAHLFRVHVFVPGMRFSGLFTPSLLPWLARNAGTFDVAHLHTGRDLVPLITGVALRLANVPYTTQTHGMVMIDGRPRARVIDRLLTERVLSHAEAQLVLTDAEEQGLTSILGARATTVRIPNGITNLDLASGPRSQNDVLFLARLHPRKRVMDFAQAAATLIAEGCDARFSIVGPDDGDLPALTDFIAGDLGRFHQIRYEGALDHWDAIARLSRATIYVLPSENEPFPMTLLEALALGTPSICTTSCGIASELASDEAALVIYPGPEPLAHAIRGLLADRKLRDEFSAKGQLSVKERFSMESVGSQLLSIYQRKPESLAVNTSTA